MAVSDTEIKLGWRVNTSGKIWYDIAVRDQNNPNDTSKDLAGVPGNKNEFQRGLTDERVIKNLKKSTNYCFVIHARTGSGRDGCVSQSGTRSFCVMTMENPPPEPVRVPPPPPHVSPPVPPPPGASKCCWVPVSGPPFGIATGYTCGPQCH